MKQINNPMTDEQFRKKLKAIDDEFKKQSNAVYIEYAISRNPYEVGDVFTDHIGSIKIEKMKAAYSLNGKSCMSYFGIAVKKDGTPTKKGEKRWAYQSNEVK
jgi:hypothetical protein